MVNKKQVERLRLFRNRYSQLMPLPPMGERFKTALKDILKDVDFSVSTFFHAPADIFKPVFLYGLLSLEKTVDFELYSATELTDIWFGKVPINPNSEETLTLSAIQTRVIGTYLGYNELPNKSLTSPIEQILSTAVVRGKIRVVESMGMPQIHGQAVWVFFKGGFHGCQSNHQSLHNLVKTNPEIQIVDLSPAVLAVRGIALPTSSQTAVSTVTTGNEALFNPPSNNPLSSSLDF